MTFNSWHCVAHASHQPHHIHTNSLAPVPDTGVYPDVSSGYQRQSVETTGRRSNGKVISMFSGLGAPCVRPSVGCRSSSQTGKSLKQSWGGGWGWCFGVEWGSGSRGRVIRNKCHIMSSVRWLLYIGMEGTFGVLRHTVFDIREVHYISTYRQGRNSNCLCWGLNFIINVSPGRSLFAVYACLPSGFAGQTVVDLVIRTELIALFRGMDVFSNGKLVDLN